MLFIKYFIYNTNKIKNEPKQQSNIYENFDIIKPINPIIKLNENFDTIKPKLNEHFENSSLMPNDNYWIKTSGMEKPDVFYINNSMDGGGWVLVHQVDNATRVNNIIQYSVNKKINLDATIPNRIAYYMENNGQYAWVSFDMWTISTQATASYDVPTGDSASNVFVNKVIVNNLNVQSNSPNVTNITKGTGALEIWPSNYGTGKSTFDNNPTNLVIGTDGIYDSNDSGFNTSIGYGSFQVHNITDLTKIETVLAWNNHSSGKPDIGFGNNTANNNTDWTFVGNGATNFKFQIYIQDIAPLNLIAPINYSPGLLFRILEGYHNENAKYADADIPKGGLSLTTGKTTSINSLSVGTNKIIQGNSWDTTNGGNNNIHNFTVQWNGFFYTGKNAKGAWTFSSSSDDGSYIWVNNILVVNYGGGHGAGGPVNGVITLDTNQYYPIKILYGEIGGGYDIKVTFQGPGVPSTTDGTGFYFGLTPLPIGSQQDISSIIKTLNTDSALNSYYAFDTLAFSLQVSSNPPPPPPVSQPYSRTDPFAALLTTKQPWGIYSVENFDSKTNKLIEIRGTGRDATVTGCTLSSASGNGAPGTVNFLSGTTSSKIVWPSGSIPSTFTICSLTRYSGGTKGRILNGTPTNWLHGHWNGQRGVAHFDGWKSNPWITTKLTDWLTFCSTNSNSVSAPNNLFSDGIASGTANSGAAGDVLHINNTYEPSDFQFSQIIIWDQTLTLDEMKLVSTQFINYLKDGLPMYKDIVFKPFDPTSALLQLSNLIITKPPWGIYSAELWGGNKISELTGKQQPATTDNVTQGLGDGNGANGPVVFLNGATNSRILFPTGSIPSTFTICSLTRYTGVANNRILQSSPGNWLHGHHGNCRGRVHYDGWRAPTDNRGNVNDWLNFCGTNSTNISVPNNILVDGAAIGNANGGSGGYTLHINNGGSGEYSNFQFSQVLIWDQALTASEMLIVSNALSAYLKSGVFITTQIMNKQLILTPLLNKVNGVTDATVTTAGLTTYDKNLNMNIITLNGTFQQYVTLNKFSIPQGSNGSSLSFTFWFKGINLNNTKIFDLGNGANSDNIICYINNNNIGLGIYNGATSDLTENASNMNINDNVWRHYVWNIQYSIGGKAIWTLYINGVAVHKSFNHYYPTFMIRNKNYLGKSNWATDPYCSGSVGDFRIYYRKLTIDEVSSLYTVGLYTMYNVLNNNNSNYAKGLRFIIYDGYFADNPYWFTSANSKDGVLGADSGVTLNTTNLASATANNVIPNGGWNNFSVEWVGYLATGPNGGGTWAFYTNSDDASYVWLGINALNGYTIANAVVNNGGGHGMSERTGTMTLIANAYYPIRIQFGQGGGGYDMIFSFTPPKGNKITDGTNYFYNIPLPPSSEPNTILNSYWLQTSGMDDPDTFAVNNDMDGGNWILAYETTTPYRVGGVIPYNVNKAKILSGTVPYRIAYYMQNGKPKKYSWVSFDYWPQSDQASKSYDIPTGGSATNVFVNKVLVSNLNVISNVPSVTNVTGGRGALEIWPSNYGPGKGKFDNNPSNLIFGSDGIYDSNDSGYDKSVGYGSFQVHNITNPNNPETALAWNNHNSGTPDIGFGNNTANNNKDWTFMNNGARQFKLQIFIKELKPVSLVPTQYAYVSDLKYIIYDGYHGDNPLWFLGAKTKVGLLGYNTGTSKKFDNLTMSTGGNVRENSGWNNFSIEWNGYLKTDDAGAGSWTFYTNSDDGSYLWIGDIALAGYTTSNALINNGGGHGMQERNGRMTLEANKYYPIRIQFGQGGGGYDMQFSFTPPNKAKRTDGTGYFYTYSIAPMAPGSPEDTLSLIKILNKDQYLAKYFKFDISPFAASAQFSAASSAISYSSMAPTNLDSDSSLVLWYNFEGNLNNTASTILNNENPASYVILQGSYSGQVIPPPAGGNFGSNTLVISSLTGTSSFMNGTYIASQSSTASSWSAWRALYNNTNDFWHSSYQGDGYPQMAYNGASPSLYVGGGAGYFWNTKVSGVDIPGEWIQIQFPYELQLTSYYLLCRAGFPWNNRGPKIFYVAGSNDGISWTKVDYQNLDAIPSGNSATFTVTGGAFYSYFRLIINQLFNGPCTHWAKWNLFGNCQTLKRNPLNTLDYITGASSLALSETAYLKVGAFTSTANGISFAFWFKANNAGTYSRLFNFSSAVKTNSIFFLVGTNNQIGVSVYNGTTYGDVFNVYSLNVNDNAWRHVTWTISPDGVNNLYINGTFASTFNTNYPSAVTRNINYLGYNEFGNPLFNGAIDDFRVYNRVLTINEAQLLCNKYTVDTPLQKLIDTIAPWGIYSAEGWDMNSNLLKELSGNGKDANTSNVSQGLNKFVNGSTANIIYIGGSTGGKIVWPSGSIPATFTICSLTRYSGANNNRILQSTPGNWLHGHWGGRRGVIHYDGWRSSYDNRGTTTDWLVTVGTNSTTVGAPDNILYNGVALGTANGGSGGYTLNINNTGEQSDFQFSQLIIWDRALTTTEMKIVSDGFMKYLSAGIPISKFTPKYSIPVFNAASVATDFATLIATKAPWGIYSAESYGANKLIEIRGNGRNAITTNITNGSSKGSGATATITYLNGNTSASIEWPSGSIPANFTICSLTRYTGGANGRVLQSKNGGNWLHGHWNGQRGVAHYDGWRSNPWISTKLTDWLVYCSTNGSSTAAPNNIFSDGEAIGTGNGGTGNYTLHINSGGSGEYSNFQFSQLIIWDQVLTPSEMKLVSNAFKVYLLTGTPLSLLISGSLGGNISTSDVNILNNVTNYNDGKLSTDGLISIDSILNIKTLQLTSLNQQFMTVNPFVLPTVNDDSGLCFCFWFQGSNNVYGVPIFDFGNGASSDNIIAYIINNNIAVDVYNDKISEKPAENITAIINDSVWHHIAWNIKYLPSTKRANWSIIVDGKTVFSGANLMYPASITRNNNFIGRGNSTYSPYLNGNIGDFRMYYRVLTKREITIIYNSGLYNIYNIGNTLNLSYLNGLYYSIYDGYHNETPSFFQSGAVPKIGLIGNSDGYTLNFTNLTTATNSNIQTNGDWSNFSVEWFGYFNTGSKGGVWTFYISSDKSSYVWLGNAATSGYSIANALINNGGIHGMQESSAQMALLPNAFYPIRIQYGQTTNTYDMVFSFTPPDGTRTSDGSNYFYSNLMPQENILIAIKKLNADAKLANYYTFETFTNSVNYSQGPLISTFSSQSPVLNYNYNFINGITAFTLPWGAALSNTFTGIAVSGDETKCIVCNITTGLIYFSTYTNKTWSALAQTLQTTTLGSCISIALTNNGSRGVVIAKGGGCYFFTWDGSNYSIATKILDGANRGYVCLDMTPDGNIITTIDMGNAVYYSKWNGTNYGTFIKTLETGTPGTGIGISKDGVILAYTVNNNVVISLWDGKNYAVAKQINDASNLTNPRSFKFGPDNNTLYYTIQGNGTSSIWYSIWNGTTFGTFNPVIVPSALLSTLNSLYSDGLQFKIYEGYHGENPNYFLSAIAKSGLNKTSGIVTSIDTLSIGTGKLIRGTAWGGDGIADIHNFTVQWDGFFYTGNNPKGVWTFWTYSDDGSYLWVNGQLLVNNGGGHGMNQRTGTITLDTNQYYPIKILFGEMGGGYDMKVTFQGPGVTARTDGTGFFKSFASLATIEPWGLSLNNDGSVLYLTAYGNTSIYKINVTTTTTYTNVIKYIYDLGIYTAYTTPWGNTISPTVASDISLSKDGSIAVYCSYNGLIYFSKFDSLKLTWSTFVQTLETSSRQYFKISLSADGNRGAVAVFGGKCYLFTWNGTNFTSLTQTLDNTIRNYSGLDMSSDGSMIVVTEQGGGVYYSTWNGTNYIAFTRTNETNNRNYMGIGISQDGTRIVYAVYSGLVYFADWINNNYAVGIQTQDTTARNSRNCKFSPDKTIIYYTVQNNPGGTLWYSKWNGSNYVQFTAFTASAIPYNIDAYGLYVSYDGGSIYVAPYNSNTFYRVVISTKSVDSYNNINTNIINTYKDGLIFKTFDGYHNDNVKLPLTAVQRETGITTEISTLSKGTSKTIRGNVWGGEGVDRHNFSVEWFGYFFTGKNPSGTWSFWTYSDDGSFLWIGAKAMTDYSTSNATVKNGGGHGMSEQTGTEYLLTNTYYPIRILYGEGGGGYDMQVSFQSPTGSKMTDGAKYFYSMSAVEKITPLQVTYDNSIPILNKAKNIVDAGLSVNGLVLYNKSINFTYLDLNGSNQYLALNAIKIPPVTNGDGMSFTFWFKSNNNNPGAKIFDFSTGRLNGNISVGIGSKSLSLQVEADIIPNISNLNLNDNVWRHFAWVLTVNGAKALWSVFINGSLIYIDNSRTYPLLTDRVLNFIGMSNTITDPKFIGDITEFRLFYKPISKNEINVLFNYGIFNYYNILNFKKLPFNSGLQFTVKESNATVAIGALAFTNAPTKVYTGSLPRYSNGSNYSIDFTNLANATNGFLYPNSGLTNFTIDWFGYFYTGESGGNYKFYLNSANSCYLWIGLSAIDYSVNNALVNNGGIHALQEKSGQYLLYPYSYYPIRIQMNVTAGPFDLTFAFSLPNNQVKITNGNKYLLNALPYYFSGQYSFDVPNIQLLDIKPEILDINKILSQLQALQNMQDSTTTTVNLSSIISNLSLLQNVNGIAPNNTPDLLNQLLLLQNTNKPSTANNASDLLKQLLLLQNANNDNSTTLNLTSLFSNLTLLQNVNTVVQDNNSTMLTNLLLQQNLSNPVDPHIMKNFIDKLLIQQNINFPIDPQIMNDFINKLALVQKIDFQADPQIMIDFLNKLSIEQKIPVPDDNQNIENIISNLSLLENLDGMTDDNIQQINAMINNLRILENIDYQEENDDDDDDENLLSNMNILQTVGKSIGNNDSDAQSLLNNLQILETVDDNGDEYDYNKVLSDLNILQSLNNDDVDGDDNKTHLYEIQNKLQLLENLNINEDDVDDSASLLNKLNQLQTLQSTFKTNDAAQSTDNLLSQLNILQRIQASKYDTDDTTGMFNDLLLLQQVQKQQGIIDNNTDDVLNDLNSLQKLQDEFGLLMSSQGMKIVDPSVLLNQLLLLQKINPSSSDPNSSSTSIIQKLSLLQNIQNLSTVSAGQVDANALLDNLLYLQKIQGQSDSSLTPQTDPSILINKLNLLQKLQTNIISDDNKVVNVSGLMFNLSLLQNIKAHDQTLLASGESQQPSNILLLMNQLALLQQIQEPLSDAPPTTAAATSKLIDTLQMLETIQIQQAQPTTYTLPNGSVIPVPNTSPAAQLLINDLQLLQAVQSQVEITAQDINKKVDNNQLLAQLNMLQVIASHSIANWSQPNTPENRELSQFILLLQSSQPLNNAQQQFIQSQIARLARDQSIAIQEAAKQQINDAEKIVAIKAQQEASDTKAKIITQAIDLSQVVQVVVVQEAQQEIRKQIATQNMDQMRKVVVEQVTKKVQQQVQQAQQQVAVQAQHQVEQQQQQLVHQVQEQAQQQQQFILKKITKRVVIPKKSAVPKKSTPKTVAKKTTAKKSTVAKKTVLKKGTVVKPKPTMPQK
jgi:hypothetical protein